MAPHRQPRAEENKYWARTSSMPLVPRSLSSSSSTEWWSSVVAAVPTVTHSASCAVLGSAGCTAATSSSSSSSVVNVPVILQRGVPGSAALCSTADTFSGSARETFGIISGFSTKWVHSAPEVNCRPALLSSCVEVATQAVAYFILVLLVLMHLALCSRRIAFTQNGEVCTVLAAAELFCLKIWTLFLRIPCLQYLQLCAVSATDFWEPSTTKSSSLSRAWRWRGRREYDSRPLGSARGFDTSG